ncbi:SUKH-4 family immunity protein [Streptomyces sp. Da 82-17]|uniref:SUKH-4 family immunity protein n=1 Tax=Streptomyces sp. Da 82-17 TaxID=3377116 RepID=UPI0038D3CEE4
MNAAPPPPDEVTPELALDRALWWVDRPRDHSAWLWFGGGAAGGKTALLRQISVRVPEAVFVDCGGRTAEEIARETTAALGIDAPNSFDRNFAESVGKLTGAPVVILANTQWAGSLRTGHEPQRVLDAVVRPLIKNHRRGTRMRLLVEVADASAAVTELGGRHLILRPNGADMSTAAEPPSRSVPPGDHRDTCLRALALAEHAFVPLEAWALLCAGLGLRASTEELALLLDRESGSEPDSIGLLLRTDTPQGTALASFRHPSTASRWRASVPPATASDCHRHVIEEIRAADPVPSLEWYVHRALAGHCAAVGTFDQLLAEPELLARVSHVSLFEAFEAVYANTPVPQGTLAATLHYVALRGVWPSSHDEWLALLHLSLLERGPSDAPNAARLLAAQPSASLPWQATWASGVAPGMFHTGALVKRPVIRTLDVAHTTAGTIVTASSRSRLVGAWDFVTGEPCSSPDVPATDDVPPASDAVTEPEIVVADQGAHGWRPAGAADGPVDLPRMPRHVRRAVRVGDHVAMASSDGVFGMTVSPNTSTPPSPTGLLKRLIRTGTQVATTPLPRAALDPTRSWLAAVWGDEAIARVPEVELPSGISDADARRFLIDVGLPCVSGFLEIDTIDLSRVPLIPGDPADSSVGPRTAAGAGPYYVLGTWQGAPLFLDGSGGRVELGGSAWADDRLAGSSLRQFVAMMRLYYWWYASDWPIEDTEVDLRHWLCSLDSLAFNAPSWQRVFEDYNFTDRV